MLNCNMMAKSLRCVSIQDQDLPMYDALIVLDEFLNKFETMVLENQRFYALKWALHMTPMYWWGTHEGTFED